MADWIDSIEERLREVQILRAAGITRIYPIGTTKSPLGKWARGEVNHVLTDADDAQVEKWLQEHGRRIKGWANLNGDKHLAVATLDIEVAGLDRHPEVIWPVLKSLPDTCQVPSRSGGQHAVIRITDGEPLHTSRLAVDGETLLAEIRGVSKGDHNGAYAIITGPGRGRLPDDFAVVEMTRAEAEQLLAPIRALHRPSEKAKKVRENRAKSKGNTEAGGTGAVLADAITSGLLTWPQLLDPGWTEVPSDVPDDPRVEFLRPLYGEEREFDRTSIASANWNRDEGPVLCVWSASVPWADTDGDGYEAFSPANALACSQFDGDYGAAMRAVEEAAQLFLITGEPTAPCEDWPAAMFEVVQEQREQDRAEYLAQRDAAVAEDAAPDQPDVDRFELEVRAEAHRLRVLEAARTRVRVEGMPVAPPFDADLLRDMAARPEHPRWRIEGLLPMDGNATVIAQNKTGKTTLLMNTARCMTTGEELLGQFRVVPIEGCIAFLNFEVSGHQIARWAIEHGVPDDRLLLVNLRGRRNPFAHEEDRDALVELLRSHQTGALFVDPFGRAYTGKSQQDPGEVGAWLADLDRFAADAGVSSTVLAVHAGWNGERSRGASALEDWPDVKIKLVKDEDSGHRYLSAEGRDVEVAEDQLTFDPDSRRLVLSGAGNRKQARDEGRREAIGMALIALIRSKPGQTVAELTEALRADGIGLQRGDLSSAAKWLESKQLIHRVRKGRTVTHYLPGDVPMTTSPDQSQQVPAGLMNESRPVPSGRDSLEDLLESATAGTDRGGINLLTDLLGAEVIK